MDAAKNASYSIYPSLLKSKISKISSTIESTSFLLLYLYSPSINSSFKSLQVPEILKYLNIFKIVKISSVVGEL